MENKTLAALVDPSGATALDVLARYWSVAQKNSQADSARRRAAVEPRCCGSASASSSPSLGYRAFRMETVAATRRRKGKSRRRGRRARARRRAPRRSRRACSTAAPPPSRGCCPASPACTCRRDPAQPALPDDHARRRAARRRQRGDAGLALRHQHVSARPTRCSTSSAASSACSC